MSLFGFLKSRSSAPVARERLQILLSHERVALGPRDLVTILRDELLATIARHIEFDPEKLTVKMDRADAMSTLEIEVEIPSEKIATGASRIGPATRASAAWASISLCRRIRSNKVNGLVSQQAAARELLRLRR